MEYTESVLHIYVNKRMTLSLSFQIAVFKLLQQIYGHKSL
jgi:hypothetical protein